MPLKIVRNDITRMETEAIVNTANDYPTVGTGCDHAVYEAAGYDELLNYRKEKIGYVEEGKAFITPGFKLKAKYIIHAVSPFYFNGENGEEDKLRSCYRESLALAKANNIKSIAFPLISTGGFGYPLEDGLRIAADEINAFLIKNDMLIYIVVFNKRATMLSQRISGETEEYIDSDYVNQKHAEEYGDSYYKPEPESKESNAAKIKKGKLYDEEEFDRFEAEIAKQVNAVEEGFQPYLFKLIESKGKNFLEVRKKALISTKNASKIKNNPDYHPTKTTALCFCIGLKLNMNESRQLLARAGYAFSPSDKQDAVFSYFIEHRFYDLTELDIQLENNGMPCIIE